MKIILKSFVDNLGDAGDIVEVANGYANNYLLPQNLAMRATSGSVADAEQLRRSRLKREAVEIAEAEELKSGMQGRVFVVSATAGEDGTLYGSVTNRDIAELVVSKTGVQVDHKRILLDRALKTVGQHTVGVKLHKEVVADVVIDIVADQIIASGSEDLEEALAEGVEETEVKDAASQDAAPEDTASDTSDETASEDAAEDELEIPEPDPDTDPAIQDAQL